MAEFDRVKYKAAADAKPEQAKTLLRESMDFSVEGVAGMITKNAEACGTFFSKLIGEPFEAGNEAHVTRVLEAGVKDSESIVDTIEFIYKNFGDGTSEQKAKKTGGGSREKKDWSSFEIPFNEGTKQYRVFSELLKWDGTMSDFKAHITAIVEKEKIETRNVASLVSTAIFDARKRGYAVDQSFGDDKKVRVTRNKTESAS